MARAGNRRGAFKLTAPDQTEVEIHEAIARYLDAALLPPAQWTTMAVGHGLLTEGETSRLVRIGVKSGWPDLVIVWNRLIFGFEIKTRTGRLSKTRVVKTKRGALREVVGQEERFRMLERAGMRVTVVRSLDEMIFALNELGIPHRGPVEVTRQVPLWTESGPVYGGVNPKPPAPRAPHPAARAKSAPARR